MSHAGTKFREVAKVGELVNWEACMDVMDLLYEKEETTVFYRSPCSSAAAILVCLFLGMKLERF